MNIPFNKPYATGRELGYISEVIKNAKICGDGSFTKKCQRFFETKFGFKKALLTTSCTDALEMAAILIDTKAGDEIIVPSFTFVSTVNAFILRGATIKFADVESATGNLDVSQLHSLINSKTKAIVPVHYAGVACDMDAVMKIANENNLFVIEDAAQAVDSYYKGKPLGSIGHLSAFSFHETKNIICGEGGMIVMNDERFFNRAEIIREKGTNRSSFFRGEIDKYGWVDMGSSFLPSELVAAYLYAQCENLEDIQNKRISLWNCYQENLAVLGEKRLIQLPFHPEYATNNAHMYYIVCNTPDERTRLNSHLKSKGISAVFHYQSLHRSVYYHDKHDGRNLPVTDKLSDGLLRLPMFYELETDHVKKVCSAIKEFYSE